MQPKIRRAKEEDISVISKCITEWLNFEVSRETSILRAVKNKELLVADCRGKLVGFIHYVIHEDIIDGDPNSFITVLYVIPEYRNKGVGSTLVKAAIADALKRGAIGVRHQQPTRMPDDSTRSIISNNSRANGPWGRSSWNSTCQNSGRGDSDFKCVWT